MSGTREGGLKAAKTNKKKYGKNFYKLNGAKGGQNGHTGGFASNPALARVAGAKGGRNSRRCAPIVSTDEFKDKIPVIEAMYKDGESMAEISRKTKIPYGVIVQWVRKHL